MKKVLYILAMVTLVLTSCTTWDDAVTENYGDGPSISIDIQAVAPTDSAFTITLTPASGTTYYTYIIDANDEAETLDAATFLRGGYGNTVLNTTQNPTLTLPIKNAAPNTTYQVYAVASNDKGIVGAVANKSIKTSDVGAPYPVGISTSGSNIIAIKFSENISRGTGNIIVTYYKEWDITNPVTLSADELSISCNGESMYISTPTIPAGAFITYSWEEGALVDNNGNKCSAFNSYLNMNTGKFVGIYLRNLNERFEVTDENIASPASGSLITNYEEFVGKITMDFDIYRNDEYVKNGDVSVIYENEKSTTIHKLSADDWSVSENTLTFTLPVKPAAGDNVTVSLAEDAIFDVYGNGNEEFTAEEVYWKYFAPTKEMALGTFTLVATIGENNYDLGNLTIVESGENLLIKDFYLEGSELTCTFDPATGKVAFEDFSYLGIEEDEGIPYAVYTYAYADDCSFTVNPNGTLTSTDFILVASPDNENLYYWLRADKWTLYPATSGAKGIKTAKKPAKKGKKLSKKLR